MDNFFQEDHLNEFQQKNFKYFKIFFAEKLFNLSKFLDSKKSLKFSLNFNSIYVGVIKKIGHVK